MTESPALIDDAQIAAAETGLEQARSALAGLLKTIGLEETRLGLLALDLAEVEAKVETTTLQSGVKQGPKPQDANTGQHSPRPTFTQSAPFSGGTEPPSPVRIEDILNTIASIAENIGHEQASMNVAGQDHATIEETVTKIKKQPVSTSPTLCPATTKRLRAPKATDLAMQIEITPVTLESLLGWAETVRNIFRISQTGSLTYATQRKDIVEAKRELDRVLYPFIFSVGKPGAQRREELKMLHGCDDPNNFPPANLTASERSALELIDRVFKNNNKAARDEALIGLLNRVYQKAAETSDELAQYCRTHSQAHDIARLSGIQTRLDAYYRITSKLLNDLAGYSPGGLIAPPTITSDRQFNPDAPLPNDYRVDGLPNYPISPADRIATVMQRLTSIRQILQADQEGIGQRPAPADEAQIMVIFAEKLGAAIHEFHKSCVLLANGNGASLAMKINNLRRCSFAEAYEKNFGTKAGGYVLETEKELADHRKISEGASRGYTDYVATLVKDQITPAIELLDQIVHNPDPAKALAEHPGSILRRLTEIGKKLRVLSVIHKKWPGERQGYVYEFRAIPAAEQDIVFAEIPASDRRPLHNGWDESYRDLTGKIDAFRQALRSANQTMLLDLVTEKSTLNYDQLAADILRHRQALAPAISGFEGHFPIIKAEFKVAAQVANCGKTASQRVNVGAVTVDGVTLDKNEGFGRSYRAEFLAADDRTRMVIIFDTLMRIDNDLAIIRKKAAIMNGIVYQTENTGNLASIMSIFPTWPALLVNHAAIAELFLRQRTATRTPPAAAMAARDAKQPKK
ncbi:MAG: hypothetical protein EYC62_04830 [Alphaproteobacteria bacterium]|nr:MAG: hypothetical protein EYC62_04830 [Alphaproteobacteria bacterium]